MKKTSWNDRNLQKLLTKIGTVEPTVVDGFSHWKIRGYSTIKEHYWFFTRAKIGKKIIWQIGTEEPFKKKEILVQGSFNEINESAWTLCSTAFESIEQWLLESRVGAKSKGIIDTL